MKKIITHITILILFISIYGLTFNNKANGLSEVRTAVLSPSGDATITSQYPNNKYGTSAMLAAGFYHYGGNAYISRSLLRFVSLSKRAELLSAKLVVYASDGGHYNMESQTVKIYVLKLGNSWAENEVTWNQRSNTVNWNTPGGDYIMDGPGFGGSYGYFEVKSTDGPDTRYEVDITNLYRYWQQHPSQNYGLMLTAPYATYYGLTRFHSRQSPDTSHRPYLEVRYRVPKIVLTQGESTVQIRQGQSYSFNLNVYSQVIDTTQGLKIKVVQNFPSGSGLTVSIDPQESHAAAFTSAITIKSSSTTPVGLYTLKLRAEGKAYTDGSLSVSNTETITVKVSSGGGFNLILDQTSIGVQRGNAGEVRVKVSPTGSFASPVTLSIQSAPQGFNIQIFNPQLMPGSSTNIRVNVDSTVVPGDYQVVLRGRSQGLETSVSLYVTVLEVPFNFQLQTDPTALELKAGENGFVKVSTQYVAGSPEKVSFSLSGLPSDSTYSFSPSNVMVNGSSTLAITAGQTPGTYLLTLRAVSNATGVTRTKNIKLTIGEEPSRFSLRVDPKKVEVNQGETATVSIRVDKVSGDARPVTLELQGLPSDSSYSFNPTVVTPPGGSILTINAGAMKGAYTVIVKARSDEGETLMETIAVKINEQKCIIATTTYGSEVSPEVSFLRGFRDNIVLKTRPGTMFFRAFNTFYYSWSPGVAQYIRENAWLKPVMKVLLYPLIGGLTATVLASQPLIDYNPTLGVYFAGTLASTLIGLFYLLPLITLTGYLLRRKMAEAIFNKALYVLCTLSIAFLGLSLVLAYLGEGEWLSLATMGYVSSLILASGFAGYVGLRWVYSKSVRIIGGYEEKR